MAFIRSLDGTRIHYEVSGKRDGEPLLLVHGLGADSRGWILQRQTLGATYRLVTVDNRGVGRSDKPAGPYDLEVMALDATAALDAAGFESAHVMGASMGGIIAQMLAVEHPERVRSLVLACTACHHLPWRRDLLHQWIVDVETLGMRGFVNRNLRWLVGPRSLRRIWPALTLLGPLAFNVEPEAFIAQVQAILNTDDALADRLLDVEVPALIIVGSQDTLTPWGDSEELASLLSNSELAVIRGGAHLFMVEHARTFNRTVTDFLAGPAAASRTDRHLTAV